MAGEKKKKKQQIFQPRVRIAPLRVLAEQPSGIQEVMLELRKLTAAGRERGRRRRDWWGRGVTAESPSSDLAPPLAADAPH